MEEGASITISDPNSEFVAKYPNGLTLDDLLPFYEDVAQNKPIQLEWKFPGRIKRPSPQDLEAKKDEVFVSGDQQEKKTDGTETSESQQQQLNFAEFDFDTETSAAADTAALVAAQRRPLGGSARPVRERRVARLDKILQEDMVRRRLEMEQLRQLQQQHQSEVQQAQSTETTSVTEKGEKEQSSAAETETKVSQPPPPSQESRSMETNEGSAASTDLPAQFDEMGIASEKCTALPECRSQHVPLYYLLRSRLAFLRRATNCEILEGDEIQDDRGEHNVCFSGGAHRRYDWDPHILFIPWHKHWNEPTHRIDIDEEQAGLEKFGMALDSISSVVREIAGFLLVMKESEVEPGAEAVATVLLAPTVAVDQGPLAATIDADAIGSEGMGAEVAVVLPARTVRDPAQDRVHLAHT
ncbi:unnamed protein product [Taenia asiatica]|uniref:DUF5523 domain-containing protein n=1 Tax=Taenia asiatica TaxID=60517 RepID=A0A0R3WFF0_TAEAS|nr:unnamed protein product [Taenia asiatica]